MKKNDKMTTDEVPVPLLSLISGSWRTRWRGSGDWRERTGKVFEGIEKLWKCGDGGQQGDEPRQVIPEIFSGMTTCTSAVIT